MESENEKEGKEYLKITLSTKRCICGNVIGNNPHSSVLVVKDGLKMFIERVISNISRDRIWNRSVG